ncbi:MAG: ABC transporter ATP-binding protein [Variibacter sp.]
MSALTLRGIEKSFGDFAAVRDFNLEMASGEFVSLLGPSGCGKTTTLRMIAGFMDPTAGVIEIDGREISSAQGSVPPEKRGMSMIFQSYAVWPNMTVAENVAFGLKLRKISRAEVEERTRRMLDIVQMGHLGARYPSELSGGQQQRVALARALVIQPDVLLLDEPLSNLDANLREEMRFEIRRLHDEFRITTVYVTHDQSEAMVASDRIAVMNGGRIEQIDAPHALYTAPKTRFVAGFIGRTNFIEGKANGGDIAFDGFSIPRAALRQHDGLSGAVTLSVRPQGMRLLRAQPGAPHAKPGFPAKVVDRAYLGEFWTYGVMPAGGGAKLKVSSPPLDMFAVDDAVWVEFDPQQIAVIH